MSLVPDSERCCGEPLPPASPLATARSYPRIDQAKISPVPCGTVTPGNFNDSQTITTLGPAIPNLGGSAAFFLPGQNGNATPFAGFPFSVSLPQSLDPGGQAGYQFQWGINEALGDANLNGIASVTSIRARFNVTQTVDSDPNNGVDTADYFLALNLDGNVIPTNLVSATNGTATATTTFGGTWRILPDLNQPAEYVFEVVDPGAIAYADIYRMKLGHTVQVDNDVTFDLIGFDFEYEVLAGDIPHALPTASCTGSTGGVAGDDFEYIDSGFIRGAVNWERTITPYINGVAQASQTINSGVAITDPAPTTNDYELTSERFCVGGNEVLRFFQSVNGSVPAQVGGDIATGQTCGDAVQVPEGLTITESFAGGNDPFGFLGIAQVRWFAVANTSSSAVTVTFASGRTIEVSSGSSQTFGETDSRVLMDVTGIRLVAADEPVTLTWGV